MLVLVCLRRSVIRRAANAAPGPNVGSGLAYANPLTRHAPPIGTAGKIDIGNGLTVGHRPPAAATAAGRQRAGGSTEDDEEQLPKYEPPPDYSTVCKDGPLQSPAVQVGEGSAGASSSASAGASASANRRRSLEGSAVDGAPQNRTQSPPLALPEPTWQARLPAAGGGGDAVVVIEPEPVGLRRGL